MKASKMIGLLAKYTDNGQAVFGEIDGIVSRADSTGYMIKDREGEVPARNILAIYQPLVLKDRVKRTAKAKPNKKSAPEQNPET